jgi:hypothetical protein
MDLLPMRMRLGRLPGTNAGSVSGAAAHPSTAVSNISAAERNRDFAGSGCA